MKNRRERGNKKKENLSICILFPPPPGGFQLFSAKYHFLRTQKMIYMPRELEVFKVYPIEIIPGLLYLGNEAQGNDLSVQKALKVIEDDRKMGVGLRDEGEGDICLIDTTTTVQVYTVQQLRLLYKDVR